MIFYLKIKKIIFYRIYDFKRFFRILFKIDQRIRIGKFNIKLNPDHLLSLYNHLYKQYDLFLPRLVKKIKKSSIIDIGANVGDTLASLVSKNNKLSYYCIEGDKFYFKYLIKNKNIINSSQSYLKTKTSIYTIHDIVGKNLKGFLKRKNGTAKLEKNLLGLNLTSLDELVKKNNIKKISLIKSDVDGYDYNVLLSGLNTIRKYKPMLFFEIMFIDKYSLRNFTDIINKLSIVGYRYWTILDNYGKILQKDASKIQLIKYLTENDKTCKIDVFTTIKKYNFRK